MTTQILEPVVADDRDDGVRRHLWTRTEFLRAWELGVFPPNHRMELIAGELIEKMPQNRPHGISLSKSQSALQTAFGDGYYVSVQTPLAMDEENEPEPDLMVVVGSPDDYEEHPTAEDVALVMEIADTTVHYDQNTKAPLYAQAGVAEYWILLLKTRTLEVRRDPILLPDSPTGVGYRSLTLYRDTDTVTPIHAGSASIPVASLLPARRADALPGALPESTPERP